VIHFERVALPPRLEMFGHGHAAVHLCLVERGDFCERTPEGWRSCCVGSLRVARAHSTHELRVGPHGLQAWVIELPKLRNGLRGDRFLEARHTPLVAALASSLAVGDRWLAECRSFELLAHCERQGAALPPAWLRRLRRELDTLPQPPSLRRLAAQHARHPAHVARSFERCYGRSIGEHWRSRRIVEAARRLRESDEPLVAIAVDLGFNDQAHLTHAFRARFGVSPGRFRRLRRA
jgi:AraC family transcriptional regulator